MAGLNASDIAYITRIPRSTVREWLASPRQSRPPRGMDIDFGALPEPEYSYLLGLYLGDGTISRHQKGVFRLRITWQERIVERHSKQFLRGLIHSDGCRVLNRVNGTDYPRYFFSQVSDDIRRLFCRTCRQLGIEYTWNNWTNVSIARRDSVAILDLFIGPKS